MVELDNITFLETSLSSLMVLSGVIVKNTLEQLNFQKNHWGNLVGAGLFILGWLYTGYNLSDGGQEYLPLVTSVAIMISAMAMKKHMQEGDSMPVYYPLIFAVSWLLLGYQVTSHLSGNFRYLGLGASLAVLLSMMISLPFERQNQVSDGPGMPLFTLAWVIISMGNSIVDL